jgi:hypothetical protein
MRDECKEIDWTAVMHQESVEQAWKRFREELEKLRDKWVYEKRNKNAKQKPKHGLNLNVRNRKITTKTK